MSDKINTNNIFLAGRSRLLRAGLTLALVLALFVSALTIVLFAGPAGTEPAFGADDGFAFAYNSQAGGYMLTEYRGEERHVVIPSQYNDGANGLKPVVTLGGWAFYSEPARGGYDSNNIRSVMLPDTIRQVYPGAFDGLYNVKSLTIPSTVETISQGAFNDCNWDMTIYTDAAVIPAGWQDDYFTPVEADRLIVLGCDLGLDVNPFGYVGQYAYVKSIARTPAFDYIEDYRSPGRAGSGFIDWYTNSSFTAAAGYLPYYPDGFVFYAGWQSNPLLCTPGLKFEYIEEYHYEWWIERYYEVSIGTATASEIIIPAMLDDIWVDRIPYNGFADECEENDYVRTNHITSITIPDSMWQIEPGAFDGCIGLASINISGFDPYYASCYAIDAKGNFVKSGGVAILLGSGGGEGYAEHEVVFAIYDITEIILPDTVRNVGDYAFYGRDKLQSVIFCRSWIDRIGFCAFSGCAALKSITLPWVGWYVDAYAFEGCDSLTIYTENDFVSVNDSDWSWETDWNPDGRPVIYECRLNDGGGAPYVEWINTGNIVNDYGYAMYAPCRAGDELVGWYEDMSFTSAMYATSQLNGMKMLDLYLFAGWASTPVLSTPGLKFTLIDGGRAYEVSVGTATTGPNAATKIIIPTLYNGLPVTKIADYGFYDYHWDNGFAQTNNIENITIPNSVTTIGIYAFGLCTALASISIPDGVSAIGGGAFLQCLSLTSLYLPSTITSMGENVFSACDNLTFITTDSTEIPAGDGLYVMDAAGNTVKSGRVVVIKSGGTQTVVCAVGGDNSLVLAANITAIGDYAFEERGSLKCVYMYGDNVTAGADVFYELTGLVIYVKAHRFEYYKAAGDWTAYRSFFAALPNTISITGAPDTGIAAYYYDNGDYFGGRTAVTVTSQYKIESITADYYDLRGVYQGRYEPSGDFIVTFWLNILQPDQQRIYNITVIDIYGNTAEYRCTLMNSPLLSMALTGVTGGENSAVSAMEAGATEITGFSGVVTADYTEYITLHYAKTEIRGRFGISGAFDILYKTLTGTAVAMDDSFPDGMYQIVIFDKAGNTAVYYALLSNYIVEIPPDAPVISGGPFNTSEGLAGVAKPFWVTVNGNYSKVELYKKTGAGYPSSPIATYASGMAHFNLLTGDGTYKVVVYDMDSVGTAYYIIVDDTSPTLTGGAATVETNVPVLNVFEGTVIDDNPDRVEIYKKSAAGEYTILYHTEYYGEVVITAPSFEDGEYEIILYDLAGNTASYYVIIDNTDPVLSGGAKEEGDAPVVKSFTGLASDVNLDKVEVYIKSGGTYTLNGTVGAQFSLTADGEYKLIVLDKATNSSTYFIIVDNTPPTLSGGAALEDDAPAVKSFSASASDTNLDRVEIYKKRANGYILYDVITVTSGTTAAVTLTAADEDGLYKIVVVDKAGNECVRFVKIDNYEEEIPFVPPVLSGSFSTVAAKAPVVEPFAAGVTGDVLKVEIFKKAGADFETVADKTLTASEAASFNIYELFDKVDGAYMVVVYDTEGGNIPYYVIIDNTAPTLKNITTSPASVTLPTTETNVPIIKSLSATADDDNLERVEISRKRNNGFVLYDVITAEDSDTIAFTLDDGDDDGVYMIVIYDKAGHTSTFYVILDNTSPVLSGGAAEEEGDAPFVKNFSGTASDLNLDYIEIWRKSGDDFTVPVTPPTTAYVSLTADGTYKIIIVDKAGNTSIYYVVVDSTPPELTGGATEEEDDAPTLNAFEGTATDLNLERVEILRKRNNSFVLYDVIYAESDSDTITFTLDDADDDGLYEIWVYDKAGNQTVGYVRIDNYVIPFVPPVLSGPFADSEAGAQVVGPFAAGVTGDAAKVEIFKKTGTAFGTTADKTLSALEAESFDIYVLFSKTDGIYKVVVHDTEGKSEIYYVMIDNTPPTLKNITTNPTDVTLPSAETNVPVIKSLSATADDVNLDKVEIYKKNAAAGYTLLYETITAPAVTVIMNSSKFDDGAYMIKVIDKAGNTAGYYLIFDNTKPILSGGASEKEADAAVFKSFAGTAVDANLDYIEIWEKSGMSYTLKGTQTAAAISLTADGTYKIVIFDKAENTSTWFVIIDNTLPVLTNVTTVPQTLSLSDTPSGAQVIKSLSATASDDNLDRVEIYKKSAASGEYTLLYDVITAPDVSVAINSSSFDDGAYKITVIDRAGNKTSYYIILDNTPPVLTVTNSIPVVSALAAAEADAPVLRGFSAEVSDWHYVKTEIYKKIGGSYGTVPYMTLNSDETSFTLNSSDGDGLYRILAFDAAGNRSEHYVIIDNTAPEGSSPSLTDDVEGKLSNDANKPSHQKQFLFKVKGENYDRSEVYIRRSNSPVPSPVLFGVYAPSAFIDEFLFDTKARDILLRDDDVDGLYIIRVYDSLGNYVEYFILLDTTPPDVTFDGDL
ncbi:MAG: leucine-rich repeat domain-containing protein, partial [Firmicutes bacterium]|nr:leucine-rich repeat domain-containing protein [Bacillota bacterium]